MLSVGHLRTERALLTRAVRVLGAGALCVGVPLATMPSGAATASGVHSERARTMLVMSVIPALGLPGTVVHFSGSSVPKHLDFTVLFDLTATDKRRLCRGTNGAHTTWRCAARIPATFGALGAHTVEMDATTVKGTQGFLELASFLVTDLGVEVAAPATTAPGDTVQLRVTANNGDAAIARGVRVTGRLPAGLHVVHVTTPCTTHDGFLRCGPIRMRPRTTRTFVLTALVTAGHHTKVVATVTIRGTPDPLRRNDTARAVLSVR